MTDVSIEGLIEDRLNDAGLIWWTDAPSADGDGQIVEGFKGDVIRAVMQAIPEVQRREREKAARIADSEGHHWSGAPAHAFFEVAERIRALGVRREP